MNLSDRFWEHIRKENLLTRGNRLLLAVSGGLDSVVLTELCRLHTLNFAIVHCNFKLRGQESDRDENFVRDLAKRIGKDLFVRDFDTASYSKEHKVSIQVAARELRYSWFSELIEEEKKHHTNGVFLLTAHHADDNIETMLMHFFRGTGIQGLRGMLSRQAHVVRPLLPFFKEELRAFAQEKSLQWVEDSSNESDKYSRNFFRNKLLPAIGEVYPSVEENLFANLERFRETELIYNQAISLHKKKLVESFGEEQRISVLKLMKTVPQATVLYEVLKEYGFTPAQVGEVLALIESESGKYVSSSTHRVIRNRQWLVIAPVNDSDGTIHVIDDENQLVLLGNMRVQFRKESVDKFSTQKSIAYLNTTEISFPLVLRKWKQGDYFYPLGMRKKKKLSRFFIDQKLSKTEKEKIWVLEMNKKIVWIVGHRIDDRFKVPSLPAEVLTVTIS